MKALLDANVLVSGIAGYTKGQSAPARAFIAALSGQYTIVFSEVILAEVRAAFMKSYFHDRFDEEYLVGKMSDLRRIATLVEITSHVKGIASHWQDDLVLATVLSGNADVLVTGDRELLELNHPYQFRIISPREFLLILDGN